MWVNPRTSNLQACIKGLRESRDTIGIHCKLLRRESLHKFLVGKYRKPSIFLKVRISKFESRPLIGCSFCRRKDDRRHRKILMPRFHYLISELISAYIVSHRRKSHLPTTQTFSSPWSLYRLRQEARRHKRHLELSVIQNAPNASSHV